jgi:hypothetical protein
MLNRRRSMIIAALAVTLASREASAEIYHLKSPSTVETDGGSKLQLPPGYFLDEETWRERDLEMKRLQEQQTRLTAENLSLRKSSGDYPWITTGVVGVFGAALGSFIIWSVMK